MSGGKSSKQILASCKDKVSSASLSAAKFHDLMTWEIIKLLKSKSLWMSEMSQAMSLLLVGLSIYQI